jgi:predicted ester cyclase
LSGEGPYRRRTGRTLAVEVPWVYEKTRKGLIPKVPLPGKYVRFRLDVIEAFERGELDSDERAA